jgi:hypothetical protein
MGTDRLNVSSNERIDISDFRFLAGESSRAALRQLGHKFLMEDSIATSEDRTGYILSGFAMSNPAASQLRVTKGKALLSQRLDGAVVQGVVTTEGDASKTLDLNSYASGTYGVYIRFEEIQGESQGRIFWNNTGNGSEYTDSVPTRYVASWGFRVEATSPGIEWLKIGEVDKDTMVITDQRPFYFEGNVDSSYQSGWSINGGGSAADRSANRADFGVTSLHEFTRAMRQCLEDIKGRGLRRWWEADIGGMNIGFSDDPIEGRLAIGNDEFYLDVIGTVPNDQPSLVVNDDTTLSRIFYNRTFDSFGIEINDVVSHYFEEEKFHTHDLELDGEVVSGLVPSTTWDFGSSGSPWGYSYFTNVETAGLEVSNHVKSHLLPDISSRNLGSATYEWGEAHVDDVYANDLLTMGASATVTGDLVPTTDGTYDIGSATNYWAVVRTKLLVPGTGSATNEGCAHLVPGQDSVFDLGEKTTPQRWRYLYVDRVYESDTAYLWARGVTNNISEAAWQTILPNTTIAAIGLTVSGTNGVLQCTAGYEGWYKCDVSLVLDPQSSDFTGANAPSFEVYRNGSKIVNTTQTFEMYADTHAKVSFTFLARLESVSDTVELRAKHGRATYVIVVNSAIMTASKCKGIET